MTVLMVTHDIPASMSYASYILSIEKAGVSFCGTKADYCRKQEG